MTRKIIHVVPHGKNADGLTALCDDGSVWQMGVPGYWVRVDTAKIHEPIPPPPPPK